MGYAASIDVPYTGDRAFKAIRDSQGVAVSMDDEKILLAEKRDNPLRRNMG